MIVSRDIDGCTAARGGCVSIGNFDGVHRGHQRILGELVSQARSLGAPAVALTFDPHPLQLLAPDKAPARLTTLPRKTELIGACGVDVLLVVSTTPELLRLAPQEFFEQYVLGRLAARRLVEGPNFFFGRDRQGDVHLLGRLSEAAGLSLTVVDAVDFSGATVSSSAIRRALAAGRVADAVAMLGHPYELEGVVTPGSARGRELGFPTANISGVATLLPFDGVYAAVAIVGEATYPAAVHLGPNATFGEQERKLEAHLVGFSGELYGRTLKVQLLDRIRDTRAFPSRAELIARLDQDVAAACDVVERRRSGSSG
jgi:riboflavin kinase/FMN adenylyltransferase